MKHLRVLHEVQQLTWDIICLIHINQMEQESS